MIQIIGITPAIRYAPKVVRVLTAKELKELNLKPINPATLVALVAAGLTIVFPAIRNIAITGIVSYMVYSLIKELAGEHNRTKK